MTLNSVKAILLTAGYGTRLRPLTDFLPKALVPLVGKPLVRHSISRLLQAGISSIGLNTHHHAELMHAFASTQNDCRLHISHEPFILGSAGGIGGFRDFLGNDDFFIVCNGDSVSDITCDRFLPDFLHHSPLVMLVLHDCPVFNNVCINKNGDVIDLRDTLRPDGTFQRLAYSGIAYMSRDFLDLIPPGASELVPLLLELITRRPGSVRSAIAHDAAWRDIGTPSSYVQAHREILLEKIPLIPERDIPSSAVLISGGSRIAEDCIMDGFVAIGTSCRIEPGCTLRNCIVWNRTTIAAGSNLNNSVCGPGFIIHA